MTSACTFLLVDGSRLVLEADYEQAKHWLHTQAKVTKMFRWCGREVAVNPAHVMAVLDSDGMDAPLP